MDYQKVHRRMLLVVCVAAIPIAVWSMFELGNFIGVQWYVSAVSIIGVGMFVLGCELFHIARTIDDYMEGFLEGLLESQQRR